MKQVGQFKGIPVYSDSTIEKGIIYCVNNDIKLEYPKRKDGKPDMRYSINKMQKMFESFKSASHKNTQKIL